MKDNNRWIVIVGLIGSICSIVSILIFFSENNLLNFLLYGALIAAGGVIGYFIKEFLFRRNSSTNKVFRTLDNAKYNKKFYTYFNHKIKNAKHDIYITGEGFECKDETGKKIAREYINAHREALTNGVRIIRLHKLRHLFLTNGIIINWSLTEKETIEMEGAQVLNHQLTPGCMVLYLSFLNLILSI